MHCTRAHVYFLAQDNILRTMDFDNLVAGFASTAGIMFFWFEFDRLLRPAASMARDYPAWLRALLAIPETKEMLRNPIEPGRLWTDGEFRRIGSVRTTIGSLIRQGRIFGPGIVNRFRLQMNVFAVSLVFYAVAPGLLTGRNDYGSIVATLAASLMFIAGAVLLRMAADCRLALLMKRVEIIRRQTEAARLEAEGNAVQQSGED